ncbi:pyrroline-5-carboxylate reductase [Candidatus Riflebacteria bacterium]
MNEIIQKKRVGIIGAGYLGDILIKGFLKAGLFQADDILASAGHMERLEKLKERYKIQITLDNQEVVKSSDIIILSVKPQGIEDVLAEIAPAMNKSKLLITVAAGVSTSFIQTCLTGGGSENFRVVRVMPNAAAYVQQAATAIADGKNMVREDLDIAITLFDAVGKTVVIKENLMNAVTGLSGNGPAYICSMLEAMSDAGVLMGLPRNISYQLSLQTILGTAKLIEKTGKHPAELREMVTSPGGTSIHALHVMEKGKFKDTIMNAVEAGTRRAEELGKK